MRCAILTSSLLLITALGCASGGGNSSGGQQKKLSANDKINQWIDSAAIDIPPVPYKVDPPDTLTINSPQVKELDNQVRTIAPDGKIDLNLVGSLYVAGKTTDEIADDIKKLAKRYYTKESLDVVVRVTGYNSKFIYVFGQVANTGKVPWTGRDTLLQVIAQSKLGEDAWPEKVIVVRPHEDPNIKQKITVDVAKMYEKGDVSDNIMLEDGDVVYVPPTPLYRVTLAFNKLLKPLVPASSLAAIARGGL